MRNIVCLLFLSAAAAGCSEAPVTPESVDLKPVIRGAEIVQDLTGSPSEYADLLDARPPTAGEIRIERVLIERVGGKEFLTIRGKDAKGACAIGAVERVGAGAKTMADTKHWCHGFYCSQCDFVRNSDGNITGCTACLSPVQPTPDHVTPGCNHSISE